MFIFMGPSFCATDAAALAFTPSTSISMISLPIFLFILSSYDLYRIHLHSYWNWNCGLQQLQNNFFLLIVNPCNPCLFSLEWTRYNLNNIFLLNIDMSFCMFKHRFYFFIVYWRFQQASRIWNSSKCLLSVLKSFCFYKNITSHSMRYY